MKHFYKIMICVGLFYTLSATAQVNHFIYIQSQGGQPYYVHLKNRVISSSLNGYATINQLKSGNYSIIIGFPKNMYKEHQFNLVIDSSNKGYLLKKLGKEDWILTDFNSNDIVMPQLASSNSSSIIFENDMIKVDTNIRTPNTLLTKLDTIQPIVEKEVKLDSPIVERPTVAVVPAQNVVSEIPMVKPKKNKFQPKIDKVFEKKGNEGIDQIFVDNSGMKPDTIAIFIPSLSNNNTSNTLPKKALTKPVTSIPNSNTCKIVANNADFLKTRVEMASATSEETMIQTGKLALKKKCYTVNQLKNLSNLFIDEHNKLNFLLAAKSSVADKENYPTLYKVFTVPAIAEQFKIVMNN